jgi:hypothetical protein
MNLQPRPRFAIGDRVRLSPLTEHPLLSLSPGVVTEIRFYKGVALYSIDFDDRTSGTCLALQLVKEAEPVSEAG